MCKVHEFQHEARRSSNRVAHVAQKKQSCALPAFGFANGGDGNAGGCECAPHRSVRIETAASCATTANAFTAAQSFCEGSNCATHFNDFGIGKRSERTRR